MSNLWLSLMDRMGVTVERHGDSTGRLPSVLSPFSIRVLDPDVVVVVLAKTLYGAVWYRVAVHVLGIGAAVLQGVVLGRHLVGRKPIAETVAVAVSIVDAPDNPRRGRHDGGAVAAAKIDAIHGVRMRMMIVVRRHSRPIGVGNPI